MTAYIFDSETTGLNSPEVVQTAWLQLSEPPSPEIVAQSLQLWRPSKPIELGALAVHHILDEELVNERPSNEFALPSDCTYLIGHNIDFDWRAIGQPLAPRRICTLAIARAFWPQLDSHTQSALVYHFNREHAKELLKGAHDALEDVRNCYSVLLRILSATQETIRSWEDLYKVSELARIPKTAPFGKYKGQAISTIPRQYAKWAEKQPDFDPYFLKAMQQECL